MKLYAGSFVAIALCLVGEVAGQQALTINLSNSQLFHAESAGYPMVVDAPTMEITYNGEERRAAIDEELLMPSMTTSHTLRGISLESDTFPLVALSNVTDKPVNASMTCNLSTGKPISTLVSLGRRETKLLQACTTPLPSLPREAMLLQAPQAAFQSGATGIQISSDDPKGELQAFGITPHTILGASLFFGNQFQRSERDELNSECLCGCACWLFRTACKRLQSQILLLQFFRESTNRLLAGACLIRSAVNAGHHQKFSSSIQYSNNNWSYSVSKDSQQTGTLLP